MKVKTLISRVLFIVTFFSLGMSFVIPVFQRKEKIFFDEEQLPELKDASWWNSEWGYSKSITIDHDQVDATLTNFPILVSISDDTDLHDHAQDDGDDLVFIASDNSTQYNHEIEYYNNDSNYVNASIWVNITTLAHDSDTVIWMYYGNSSASNQEDVAGTWNSNYVIVQHLNESDSTASNHYTDSTGYNNHGTLTDGDGDSNSVSGVVGNAFDFSSDNDYILINDDNELDIANDITLEAWVDKETLVNWDCISFKCDPSDQDPMSWQFGAASAGYGSNKALVLDYTDVGGWNTHYYDNVFDTAAGWQYVAISFDDVNVRLYEDGSKISTQAETDNMETSSYDVYIGSLPSGNGFIGVIDEFRVSDTTRSDAWIDATYNTINNVGTFITKGSENSYSAGWSNTAPTFSNPVPTNSSTGVSLQSTVNVTVTDADGNQSTCDFYTSTNGVDWTWRQHNTTILNESIGYSYTQANAYSTLYYWKVSANDTHDNSTVIYHFTTEAQPSANTSVDAISPYNQTSTPITITASNASAVDKITLYYRYSDDNSSWGAVYGENWYNDSYTYRKLITIDNTFIDETLTNFPILIYRNSDSDLSTHAQGDGDDILFVSFADNTTKYNHQRESYSSGTLYAWVNVTSISDTSDTKIWMYYGNDSCGYQGNNEATWNNDYEAVYHMNEASGTVYDSTSNSVDSESETNITYSQTGKIGDCLTFDNSSIDLGNAIAGFDTSTVTVEAWVKYSGALAYDGRIICTGNESTNKWLLTVTKTSPAENKVGFSNSAASHSTPTTDSVLNNDNWHYVVGKNSPESVFLNGTAQTGAVTDSWTLTANSKIGYGRPTGTNLFQYFGDMDEIRVSSVIRSTGWVNASFDFMNQTTGLISVGSETTNTTDSGYNWSIYTGGTNPDESSPFSWSFSFPNSTGYYEFYSVGNKSGYVNESLPGDADTICYFELSTVAPTVVTNTTTDVTNTSAKLWGYLTDDGSENCNVWFEWDDYNLTEECAGFMATGDVCVDGRSILVKVRHDSGTSQQKIFYGEGTNYSFWWSGTDSIKRMIMNEKGLCVANYDVTDSLTNNMDIERVPTYNEDDMFTQVAGNYSTVRDAAYSIAKYCNYGAGGQGSVWGVISSESGVGALISVDVANNKTNITWVNDTYAPADNAFYCDGDSAGAAEARGNYYMARIDAGYGLDPDDPYNVSIKDMILWAKDVNATGAGSPYPSEPQPGLYSGTYGVGTGEIQTSSACGTTVWVSGNDSYDGALNLAWISEGVNGHVGLFLPIGCSYIDNVNDILINMTTDYQIDSLTDDRYDYAESGGNFDRQKMHEIWNYTRPIENMTVDEYDTLMDTIMTCADATEAKERMRDYCNDTASKALIAYEANTTWYSTNESKDSGISTGTEFNQTITGLEPGTVYYYRAWANNTEYSSSGSILKFMTLPDKPYNTANSSVGTDFINLTWTKGNGSHYTIIERNTTETWSRGEGTERYNGTLGYFNDTSGLSSGTTYYYQFWSYVSAEGEQAYSSDYGEYNTTTSSVSRDWQETFQFNMSFSNTSPRDWTENFTWNISFSNYSEIVEVFQWNLSFSNVSDDTETMQWNISFSAPADMSEISQFNISFSNSSAAEHAFAFNISFSNTTSQSETFQWNISFSNTSPRNWTEGHQWNLSFSNTTDDREVFQWNLSFSNSSVSAHILEWNISFSNVTDDTEVAQWNLSFSNISTRSWTENYTFNISFSNITSDIETFQFNISFSNSSVSLSAFEWNLSFSNFTSNKEVMQFNISFSNTSARSWEQNYTWNISFSNVIDEEEVFQFNISFSNKSTETNLFIWNISFANTTSHNEAFRFNISFSNVSERNYTEAFAFNISFSNSTDYIETFSWNISFRNSSVSASLFEWNISFGNTTSMKETSQFNISFSNTSTRSWIENYSFNISFSNVTYFKETFQFNISFRNSSLATSLFEWNISFSNTSDDTETMEFNISFSNTSPRDWKESYTWNISFSNISDDNEAYQFNISFRNSSVPTSLFEWNISFSNKSDDTETMQFNMSFSNLSPRAWEENYTFNISFSNTTDDTEAFQFNISFSNVSNASSLFTWNLSFSNTSIYNEVSQFNISFSNTSDQDWTQNYTFNISFRNSSLSTSAFEWNLSFSNITNFKETLQFNMSFSNTSDQDWTEGYIFNLSFSNTSDDSEAYQFNISFSNSSLSTSAFEWNISFSNTSPRNWTQNFTFNISFSNVSPRDFIETFQWNISFSNISDNIETFAFNLSFSNVAEDAETFLFNISFSNFSKGLNQTFSFNISFSNVSLEWNETSSFNISFSDVPSDAIEILAWNISFSNTTTHTETFQFNLSFSNVSPRDWTQNFSFNISFSNLSKYYEKFEFNISFSNSSEPVIEIVAMYPADNSTDLCPLTIELGIEITHPNGSEMNISIFSNLTTGVWTLFTTGANPYTIMNITNGTHWYMPNDFVQYNYTYYWNVSLNDGNETIDSRVYKFTTTATNCSDDLGGGSGTIVYYTSAVGIVGLLGILGFIYRKRNGNNKEKKKNRKEKD